jgi:hypothetical protein
MKSARSAEKRKKVIRATAVAAPARKRARRHVAAHPPKWIDQPPEDWGDQNEAADRWLLERQAEDVERDDH